MNPKKVNIEKTLAVLVVAVALLFVAYGELSDTITGAVLYKNEGWANCRDTDPENDITVQGKVTVSRFNLDTDRYEPLAPYVDECIGPSRVREWKCADYDKPIAEERNTYCTGDTVCRDGACV